MNTVSNISRIKAAIVLIALMMMSIVPVPITSTIGLYVVIFRPLWFKQLVENIYLGKSD